MKECRNRSENIIHRKTVNFYIEAIPQHFCWDSIPVNRSDHFISKVHKTGVMPRTQSQNCPTPVPALRSKPRDFAQWSRVPHEFTDGEPKS